jgi:hypothetical protein
MTPEEVEACFGIHGEMSGDYVHTVSCIDSPPCRWKQEAVHVIVVFDNGRVTEAKVLVETKTLAEWLKGWIGL